MKKLNGFTLIEILVCVAIISILSSIAIVSYQGSLDSSELNYVLPNFVHSLNDYKSRASTSSVPIIVEFKINTGIYKAYWGNPDKNTPFEEIDLLNSSLIKRKLKFRKYIWDDGEKTPAIFTFYQNGKIEGGKVYFGSAFAEAEIYIEDSKVYYKK